MLLKEYFKKNALLYQYIYFTLFTHYSVKSKLAFEVAHAGYQNQKESLCFVKLQPPIKVKQEQNEIVDEVAAVKVVETAPSKSTSAKITKKRKVNTEKMLMKQKKQDKKKLDFWVN